MSQAFRDGPGGFDAGGPRLGQTAGDARPVAHGEEAGQGSLQLIGQGQPGGIELDLRPVEQGIIVGGAGGQLVQLVDHFNDIVQLPLGQSQGQVPGHGGGEGGVNEGLAHPVLVGPPAPHQIPEPLDQHAPRQHIGR